LGHETERGPDWIVTGIQVFEGNVGDRVRGIDAGQNAVGVGIEERVNTVDGEIFSVGFAEGGGVAGGPEEIAEAIVAGACGLELGGHFRGADDATAVGELLARVGVIAVERLEIERIAEDGSAAAIIAVLRIVELRAVDEAPLEGVVGAGERFGHERGNSIGLNWTEEIGGPAERAIVEIHQDVAGDVGCGADAVATRGTDDDNDRLGTDGGNAKGRNGESGDGIGAGEVEINDGHGRRAVIALHRNADAGTGTLIAETVGAAKFEVERLAPDRLAARSERAVSGELGVDGKQVAADDEPMLIGDNVDDGGGNAAGGVTEVRARGSRRIAKQVGAGSVCGDGQNLNATGDAAGIDFEVAAIGGDGLQGHIRVDREIAGRCSAGASAWAPDDPDVALLVGGWGGACIASQDTGVGKFGPDAGTAGAAVEIDSGLTQLDEHGRGTAAEEGESGKRVGDGLAGAGANET